jgi:hypothetical protein
MSQPGKAQNKKKRGRPTKATPKLIEAILADLAHGLTREQACACNGVSVSALRDWEQRPEFSDLRARAEASRIKYVLTQIEQCDSKTGGDWKRWQWFLQCKFPEQFGAQVKATILAQQNNFQLSEEKCREIDARVKMLEDADSSSDWPPNGVGDSSFETRSNKQP